MFSKVLIADDLGSINQGVTSVLKSLKINNTTQVQYCDDAYLQIKKGLKEQEPFELLITDLSFKIDYRSQKLTSGDALIDCISKEHSELPIIVYSVEDRLQRVKRILATKNVVGYVNKGRKGLNELTEAIKFAQKSNTYVSPELKDALEANNHLDFSDYDIAILSRLADGLSQTEISKDFNKLNIKPASLSALEKRLSILKIEFKVNNSIHLIAVAKDLGLI